MENQKSYETDALIIGGGPGGYVAAIRLGQLGKSVMLVEKDKIGGVCLNWGCIPSKALIHAAKLYEEAQQGAELGIHVEKITLDWQQTQAWKQGIVKKLTQGIGQLAKSVGVKLVKGEASFIGPNEALVKGQNNSTAHIHFSNAIIATGSVPINIPGFSMDGRRVVDSQQALDWLSIPKRMFIIGGGVIGLEMGMLYEKLGAHVTIVELMDQLLPGFDTDLAQMLKGILRNKNFDIHLSSKALSYEVINEGSVEEHLRVHIETPSGQQSVDCDIILLSVGRRPYFDGLNLDAIGVKTQGMIPVNHKRQTNFPHIFAIGDVTGPPLLAHKASKEGIVAAEVIAGLNSSFDVRAMPAAVFTDPEIAIVGFSEQQAIAEGYQVKIGKFPLSASGRALAGNSPLGFAKIIGDAKTDVLLGVHILGPHASDLISEAALAIEMGALVDDLALTVHPHPTFSEILMEGAEAAHGKAIHMVNKNVG